MFSLDIWLSLLQSTLLRIYSEPLIISLLLGLTFQSVCILVAVLLHYFYLAAFGWMLLEGVFLYVMIVEVFNTVDMRYLYFFGWGKKCNNIIATVMKILTMISTCIPQNIAPIVITYKWKEALESDAYYTWKRILRPVQPLQRMIGTGLLVFWLTVSCLLLLFYFCCCCCCCCYCCCYFFVAIVFVVLPEPVDLIFIF